ERQARVDIVTETRARTLAVATLKILRAGDAVIELHPLEVVADDGRRSFGERDVDAASSVDEPRPGPQEWDADKRRQLGRRHFGQRASPEQCDMRRQEPLREQ